MSKVTVSEDRCKGCGLCADACPKKLLALSSRINARGYHPVEMTDQASCVGCGMCFLMCPDCALTVEREA